MVGKTTRGVEIMTSEAESRWMADKTAGLLDATPEEYAQAKGLIVQSLSKDKKGLEELLERVRAMLIHSMSLMERKEELSMDGLSVLTMLKQMKAEIDAKS